MRYMSQNTPQKISNVAPGSTLTIPYMDEGSEQRCRDLKQPQWHTIYQTSDTLRARSSSWLKMSQILIRMQ